MELLYNFFPELAWLVASTGQSKVCQMLDRVRGSPAGPTGSREMRGLVPLGDGRLPVRPCEGPGVKQISAAGLSILITETVGEKEHDGG
jgi:hypothetical protein